MNGQLAGVLRGTVLALAVLLVWSAAGRDQVRAQGAGQDRSCEAGEAQWIWAEDRDPQAKNAFTYFRRDFTLSRPADAAMAVFAADPTAQFIVNGVPVRRKVTRYTVDHVRPELIRIGPYLKKGANRIVILHHNWGDIKNFQREKRRRGGVYVKFLNMPKCRDLNTGAAWRSAPAPQFNEHEQQIIGVTGHARIRFPVVMDGAKAPGVGAAFDALDWRPARVIDAPIWTLVDDEPFEGQREYLIDVQSLVKAGRAVYPDGVSVDRAALWEDVNISSAITNADYAPDEAFSRDVAARMASGAPLSLTVAPGETKFLTFDFHQPLHGFVHLEVASDVKGAALSFGYAEKNVSHLDGALHVDPQTGALHAEAVVGDYYADRYLTAGTGGVETVELPDERTARYMTVHVTNPGDAPKAARVSIHRLGLVKSQYPVDWLGGFNSGHPRLDQIVALSKMHAEVTMSDGYVDTPGREDGSWLEDIQPRARIADSWTADSGALRRLIILQSEESRIEGGKFLSFAPQSFVDLANYDWGVQWIGMLYDEWRWTGDRDFLNARYPALATYVDILLSEVDDEGLFRTDQVFADIRVGAPIDSEDDVSAIAQAWLISRLDMARTLAEVLRKEDDVRAWEKARRKLIAGFRKHLVVRGEDGLRYAADILDAADGAAKGKSQAAQLSAIEAGLFSEKQSRKILDHFFPAPFGRAPEGVTPWNNPTYSERAVTQLSRHGLGARAVAHLLWRYSYYLPFNHANTAPLALHGPYGGPLPEYFVTHQEAGMQVGEAISAQPIDPTGSHGWAAAPMLWLHETVLGVGWTADDPANRVLTIAPQDYGLPFVNGWSMTPEGPVYVSWDPGAFKAVVELPAGARAQFTMPRALDWKAVRRPVDARVVKDGADGFVLSGGGRYEFGLVEPRR